MQGVFGTLKIFHSGGACRVESKGAGPCLPCQGT